jgi:hypothetical protein
LTPVPLGTLNGDWAQYGGVVAAWATAGMVTASASTVPSTVTRAAASAASRFHDVAAAVKPGGL